MAFHQVNVSYRKTDTPTNHPAVLLVQTTKQVHHEYLNKKNLQKAIFYYLAQTLELP
ncbi:hypothetical protein [Undibacterium sp. Tian12W]|uniref:hypothetical protein n=1 Tax=Undibacterium sp. Tian12W TaxID=3413054 RepID=UPI003BF11F0B